MTKGYQGVALRKEFIEAIKKHIKDKPQYSTVTSFIRYATIKQMNEENLSKR